MQDVRNSAIFRGAASASAQTTTNSVRVDNASRDVHSAAADSDDGSCWNYSSSEEEDDDAVEMLLEELKLMHVHPWHLLCADGGSGFGSDVESGADTDSQESQDSQSSQESDSQGSEMQVEE